MPPDIKILKTMDIFSDLSTDELAALSTFIHPMYVTEGEVLTQRQESAHTFFVVLKGNFLVSFKDDRGITLHNRGDILGWSSLVSPFRYTGTSVALTDGEVLTLASQDFQNLAASHPDTCENLLLKINNIVSKLLPRPDKKDNDA